MESCAQAGAINMRLDVILVAVIASTPASAGQIEITLTTPASIAISEWCAPGEACDQIAADQA
jgi:hypothetical protein